MLCHSSGLLRANAGSTTKGFVIQLALLTGLMVASLLWDQTGQTTTPSTAITLSGLTSYDVDSALTDSLDNGEQRLHENGASTDAASQPEGVPADNWLPLNRGDYGIDSGFRFYVPGLEESEVFGPPRVDET
ncbi:hypothetical protein LPB19_00455 [Marinobacter salinisoli]|uniref:Uncharacterized protein n=1 Tax=Marinobacter salinisoli TaxID=2769486 RepID=A0ABX7MRJ5_9GAMM|nr:hypothetical protein [Marinobacter salinisoli]QSP94933.1 hypothetical protein LPB19_00455 [Marinobacter salinisoli]